MRVLRVVARMTGGSAYNVSLLTGRLDPRRYESLLVHGGVGPGEASLAWLARADGCRVEEIAELGPAIRPRADLTALRRLAALVRRFRPDIVHTHTAKAGMLGRLAPALAARPRPIIVHTYHGHVLEGYFGPVANGAYRSAERLLARLSDCLVGVSQATVDDLVRLGIAPAHRFRVIPIGLDLQRFAEHDDGVAVGLRRRIGVRDDEVLITFVGRLVPIKRVDLALRAVGRLRTSGAPVRLAIVGDGECRARLERLTAELGLSGVVAFLGHMDDVRAVAAAADIAVLSSRNEGTPVSLIEAAAAGKPSVATSVGGVADVVLHGQTGLLVGSDDEEDMAELLLRLVRDAELRARLGANAQRHVIDRFSTERLLGDVEALYDELIAARA